MARNLLLISSSTVHGYGYLENVAETLRTFLNKFKVKNVLFIPYAINQYEVYLNTVKTAFSKLSLGSEVKGIHDIEDPVAAVNEAEAIFIGGGNTFLLLNTLYDLKLVEPIRKRVLENGIPYIGSSAGTNVATTSIHTTNDMPIIYPPSFDALNLVPFNINPHYIESLPHSTHMGETREQRIVQYLEMDSSKRVLALREGSSLLVKGSNATLVGDQAAVLFEVGSKRELAPGSDLSFLLNDKM